eukprot:scaffold4345_cov125-Cylindrotheca_fusiformis.AAC.2
MSGESSSISSSLQVNGLPQEIVNFILETKLMGKYSLRSIDAAKSAQQVVFVLHVDANSTDTFNTSSSTVASSTKTTAIDNDTVWANCLTNGCNRLVVRLWKGGSNWWNLNRNQDPTILARSEIMGYQLSYQAFVKQREATTTTTLTIPRILHYELSPAANKGKEGIAHSAWAVLEYVGPHSTKFGTANRYYYYDDSYLEGMVKVRHEFGFDEPHPRWGRVPEDESLKYATLILNQFVIPLQNETRNKKSYTSEGNGVDVANVKTYATMIQQYKQLLDQMLKPASPTDNNKKTIDTPLHDSSGGMMDDDRMVETLRIVDRAVTKILPHNTTTTVPPMSPVLVHLDLQPQNILFAKNKNKSTPNEESGCIISSVLDWEDAAFADPRFEILLLCRKVCSNRSQANKLWSLYSDKSQEDPGPIEPWLQLETIHSIITLLLQFCEMHNGGRNPWETKNDLWGKIQRELHRWNELLPVVEEK